MAYKNLHELFFSSSLNTDEKTIVWQSIQQTINIEHGCHYCIPAHTGIAQMMNAGHDLIDALRNSSAMPTEKLQVLHNIKLSLVRNRGKLSQDEREAFYSVEYNKQQLLEIVLGISQKVISNYVNHLADTPVDDAFKKFQ